jgi:gamma-glutamylcyclotransferase (GGCT)/AIG2-like uncharacterized protein YtfP
MKHIAAYGTLRVGHFNFSRFSLTPIKQNVEIKGFDLYDLGPYPCVVENPDGQITVDILQCSEHTLQGIRRMEVGAGYEYKKINIGGIECEIYFFNNIPKHANKIENGNYNRETK